MSSISSLHIDISNDLLLWTNTQNNLSVAAKAFITPFIINLPIETMPSTNLTSARAITTCWDAIYLLGDDGYIYIFETHFNLNPSRLPIRNTDATIMKLRDRFIVLANGSRGVVLINYVSKEEFILGNATDLGEIVDIEIKEINFT